MAVPSWATTDIVILCQHVEKWGNAKWGIASAAVHKPAVLCALKWHVLYLAHQAEKLRCCTFSKEYTDWADWELGVLLRGWPGSPPPHQKNKLHRLPQVTPAGQSVPNQRTMHQVLAEFLPGRTANAVKQAVKSYLGEKKHTTLARLAGCPPTLREVLQLWPGPKLELQEFQHLLLPDTVIAAQILDQMALCSPASTDAAALSAAELSGAPEPPADHQVPDNTPALGLSPATEAGSGSGSSSPEMHAFGLGYTALQAAVFAPESNCSSGSASTVSHSMPSNANMGHGFWLPGAVPAADVGASVGNWRSAPTQPQPPSAVGTSGLSTDCSLISSAAATAYHGCSSPAAEAAVDFGALEVDNETWPVQSQPAAATNTSPGSDYYPGHGFLAPTADGTVDVCAFGVDLQSLAVQLQPVAATNQATNRDYYNYFVAHEPSPSLAGAASDVDNVGAFEVDLRTATVQLQPVAGPNKSRNSKYKRPRAATVKSGSIAAMPCSKPQQRQVLRKRKASSDPSDKDLEPLASPAEASMAAAEVGSQQQPAKVHCGSGRCRIRYSTAEQQEMPMELQCAWQNLAQSSQLQCPDTSPMSWDFYQASCAAGAQPPAPMNTEAFLHENLSPAVAAAGAYLLQPQDDLSGIYLADRDSSTDSVQQLLDSPLLSECSTHTAVPAVAAMLPMSPVTWHAYEASGAGTQPPAFNHESMGPTAAAAGEYALQPQDDLAGGHIAGHNSSTDSVQQLLDSPLLSECSTDTAALDWSPEADMQLAPVEDEFSAHELEVFLDQLLGHTVLPLAGHHAAVGAPAAADPANVQGQQPWQQQQQGASDASAVDLAAQAATGDICWPLTDADLAAAMQEALEDLQAVASATPPAAVAETANVQPGASYTYAGGLAVQGAAGDFVGSVLDSSAADEAAILELFAEHQALELQHHCLHQPGA